MKSTTPGPAGAARFVHNLSVAMLVAAASDALAQAWPAKPIRIVVPYAAGGPLDDVARTIGVRMTETFGQTVVVDNRGGAGGSLGADMVARSAPDGYTILLGNSGPMTINPNLMKKIPYDAVKDFAPMSLVLNSPMLMVVHPSLPVKTVADLVNLARKRPNELNYASAGVGNLQHLGMESVQASAGIRMNHVPYKGAAPAFIDIFGGRIELMFANIVGAMPHVKAGKLRAIAVSSAKRSSALPDVPSVGETIKGFDMTAWMGLFGAAGTPKDIVNRVSSEVARIVQLPDVRTRMLGQGAEPVGGTPQELADLMARETALYAKIIKASGIQAE
ncbi:MAG: Bug family tripartite tricarboxylate transporter substrate binding protein [bacterium]|jgi:tripartite-type tricarboxylate transporter receptor subunit TctC|nr:tripartite tricarboxylate transporter substrate binding protein [Betaproteobacteria bacterium]